MFYISVFIVFHWRGQPQIKPPIMVGNKFAILFSSQREAII